MVLAVIAAVLAVIARRAPAASPVKAGACSSPDGAACIIFPTVSGANLNSVAFTFPADFAGNDNLVVISFDEGQTVRAADWLPLAESLAGQRPDFAYYSVPVMQAVNPVMRALIVGGMVALIPDDRLRERTVMLFLDDKQAFLDALAIPDLAAIQVLLVSARGEVLWRASGDYSDAAGAALRDVLRNRN